MTKIELLDEYLGRCKKVLDENDYQAQESLTYEIICTFGAEIPKIIAGLSAEIVGDEVCYIPNIPQLEARLRNYQAYLVDENKKAEREIDKLKLQSLIINNTNHNTAVATSSVSLSVTIEQTIERIHGLPENELSEEDKDWFEEQLSFLSLSKNKKDKGAFWNKAKPILAKAADKGFDLAKIALPFILKIITEIPD